MIPSFELALAHYEYIWRARGFTDYELTAGDLQAALDHAGRLAPREADEPAALFFALAKLSGPLGQAWPLFPVLMGRNHAAGLGVVLRATNEELEELAWDVCLEGLTFQAVREWFRERGQPRPAG